MMSQPCTGPSPGSSWCLPALPCLGLVLIVWRIWQQCCTGCMQHLLSSLWTIMIRKVPDGSAAWQQLQSSLDLHPEP